MGFGSGKLNRRGLPGVMGDQKRVRALKISTAHQYSAHLASAIIDGCPAESPMPIYAYRCSACGYQNDYLQKISEPLLTDCPECGKSTFKKQVTAAGFQLKGSGWYATDFKDNGKKAKSGGAKEESKAGSDKGASDGAGSSGDGESKTASSGGAGATPA